MNIADFDYELPPGLIAQTPIEPRDASRLLVVHRDSGRIEHRVFREIGDYLRPDRAPPVVLVAGELRPHIALLIAEAHPGVPVVAFEELAATVEVIEVGRVGGGAEPGPNFHAGASNP